MTNNIVMMTICHSLCAAASIIFLTAAVMSGWGAGETLFALMFLGIIQGAVISSFGLLALRSRGLLPNRWKRRTTTAKITIPHRIETQTGQTLSANMENADTLMDITKAVADRTS